MKKSLYFSLAALLSLLTFACDDQSSGMIDKDLEELRKMPYEISIFLNDTDKGARDIRNMDEEVILSKEIQENGVTVKEYSVKISDVIQAQMADLKTPEALDAFLNEYVCDYEASDGFRPSDKLNSDGSLRCPPRPCSTTKTAYVNLQTTNLSYDETLTGCYSVKGLKKIHIKSKAQTK